MLICSGILSRESVGEKELRIQNRGQKTSPTLDKIYLVPTEGVVTTPLHFSGLMNQIPTGGRLTELPLHEKGMLFPYKQ